MANGDQIRDAVLPLETRLSELHQRVDESDEWRRSSAKILERLSIVVVGDRELGHKGLVERVNEHSTFIAGQETRQAEIRGGRKTLVAISAVGGAILAKAFDGAIALLTSRGH